MPCISPRTALQTASLEPGLRPLLLIWHLFGNRMKIACFAHFNWNQPGNNERFWGAEGLVQRNVTTIFFLRKNLEHLLRVRRNADDRPVRCCGFVPIIRNEMVINLIAVVEILSFITVYEDSMTTVPSECNSDFDGTTVVEYDRTTGFIWWPQVKIWTGLHNW